MVLHLVERLMSHISVWPRATRLDAVMSSTLRLNKWKFIDWVSIRARSPWFPGVCLSICRWIPKSRSVPPPTNTSTTTTLTLRIYTLNHCILIKSWKLGWPTSNYAQFTFEQLIKQSIKQNEKSSFKMAIDTRSRSFEFKQIQSTGTNRSLQPTASVFSSHTFIHPSIYSPVHPSHCPSISLSFCSFVHLFLYSSLNPSLYSSVHLSL